MHISRPVSTALIIGSGIAGCTAALSLADAGIEVTLINSGAVLNSGNSTLAQGGIVFSASEHDAPKLQNDILVAGHHYNSMKAVHHVSTQGPVAVQKMLIERCQIPFNRREDGAWDMALEGGHSEHRILHCADYSGRAIMEGLMREVLASPNIRVLNKRTAIDLLTSHHHANQLEFKYQLEDQCAGAYIFNEEANCVETHFADYTVLATGGIGQVYLHTTNSSACVGSGIAMAYRAGARVNNMEFMQFHPTALYHNLTRRFLITEALRGAGAKLVHADRVPFMHRYDAREDLAPRDIVARAMAQEMLHTGEPCVFLDAAQFATKDLPTCFPTIYKQCLALGIDICKQPIPVVPAAHYFCGGILCDLHGQTTLKRLYSVGECSCTGVHGANRLASTSLLEALLWGYSAANHIAKRISKRNALSTRLINAIPDWKHAGSEHNDDPVLIAQDWANLRTTMWNYVGITRTTSRLKRANNELRDLWRHLNEFYNQTPISKPLIDLFHGCQTGSIVTAAALRNTQSLGCHYRID